jgi:hypothetical protein
MANEVKVIEMKEIRGKTPVMVRPKLATQTLSIGGAVSAAFNKGTSIVGIRTTTDCQIEFSNRDGTAPNGSGAGDGAEPLLAAWGWQFYEVKPGSKVIVVA